MFRHIQDLLSRRLQGTAWRPQVEATRVIEVAKSVLAEELPAEVFREVHPTTFRSGMLTIETNHPAFAQQLQLQTKQLLGQLNKKSPYRVQGIRIVMRKSNREG